MLEALIVADDLTSAADCAAGFAARGTTTVAALHPATTSDVRGSVLAIDTDSRHCAAEQAAARVETATRVPARLRFKSMDSQLRGNVGRELAAFAEAARPALLVVAPAFPAHGRTTEHGRQLVHGMPAERGEAGADPRTPATSSDVVALLSDALARSVGLVPLRVVRAGDRALGAALAGRPAGSVAVVDATSEEDLACLARACAALSPTPALAGSTGLARHLPDAFASTGGPHLPLPPCGRVLVVAGSSAEATRLQLDVLRARGASVHRLSDEADVTAVTGALARELARGHAVLGAPGAGTQRWDPETIVRRLAEITESLLSAGALDGLVVTGGDTARSVCDAAGVRALRVLGELEPGVPVIRAEGHSLPVVLKAGAFGAPDTLARCVALLRSGGWQHGAISDASSRDVQ